jgi:hypothetical protein
VRAFHEHQPAILPGGLHASPTSGLPGPGHADHLLYTSDQGGNELSHLTAREVDGTIRDLTPGLKLSASLRTRAGTTISLHQDNVMVPLINFVVATLGAVPVAGALYLAAFAYRAKWRNAVEQCGHCGGPLYATGASTGPSLIQGQLVCAPCVRRSARRMGLALGATALLGSVIVIGTALGAALNGGGAYWWFPAAAAAQYSLLVGGALAWMKRRNRKAATALAAGAGPRDPVVLSSDV